MGICESKKHLENNYNNLNNSDYEYISKKRIIQQMNKSICLICNENSKGTGFLCLISYQISPRPLRVLITCNHVLNDLKIGDKIKLIFEFEVKIIIIDESRRIYINKEYNITIIELKENEFEDNEYLQIDDFLIYKENELNKIYKNKLVYIIHYPNGEGIAYSIDKIKKIENNIIEHLCKTNFGSSGAPILNLENNKVIGIHIGKIKDYYYGKIIKLDINDFNKKFKPIKNNEIMLKYQKELDKLSNKENNNYIIAEIEIKEADINKDIRIINSYEQCRREYNLFIKDDNSYENEKEIKENCEIKINNKIIEFSYFYRFNKKDKYSIEYSFKNNLSKINHMFYNCSSLKNINLSNFNAQNVIYMNYLFSGCCSIKNINFTNFNTENVINMSHLFHDCKSLTNINLSNFNTQNVSNMSYLFSWCNSLTEINLSNFNTQNVTNMSHMFYLCSSLTNINLSNFNTQKVTNMDWMFSECFSLKNIDLSNFNTENVINMSYMFYGCKTLTNINLSNFKVQDIFTDISGMFDECISLKKENIIIKDRSIISEFY